MAVLVGDNGGSHYVRPSRRPDALFQLGDVCVSAVEMLKSEWAGHLEALVCGRLHWRGQIIEVQQNAETSNLFLGTLRRGQRLGQGMCWKDCGTGTAKRSLLHCKKYRGGVCAISTTWR